MPMKNDVKQTSIYLTPDADRIIRRKCYEWDITRKELWARVIMLLDGLDKKDLFPEVES